MKKTRSAIEAIQDRIFALCEEKKYETAIKEAESLMKGRTVKQKTVGVRTMAYILRRQKRKAEANEMLLKAAEKHSRDRAIHDALILSLIDCARYQEVIPVVERLVNLDKNRRWRPYTGIAHFRKAYALFRLGRLDEAESELKRVRYKGNTWIEGHLSSKPLLLEQIARERRRQSSQ